MKKDRKPVFAILYKIARFRSIFDLVLEMSKSIQFLIYDKIADHENRGYPHPWSQRHTCVMSYEWPLPSWAEISIRDEKSFSIDVLSELPAFNRKTHKKIYWHSAPSVDKCLPTGSMSWWRSYAYEDHYFRRPWIMRSVFTYIFSMLYFFSTLPKDVLSNHK